LSTIVAAPETASLIVDKRGLRPSKAQTRKKVLGCFQPQSLGFRFICILQISRRKRIFETAIVMSFMTDNHSLISDVLMTEGEGKCH
jgi:hypothetical protein